MKAELDAGGGSVVFLSACVSGASGGYAWRPPARPVVTDAAVRAHAVRAIPPAALGIAPKTATLVNIQTLLWTAAPLETDLPVATLADQQVRIHLHLHDVAYDYGDDHSDLHGPPGTAYNPRTHPCRTRLCPYYFGHIYTRTGTMHLSATAHWTVSYTVDNGAVHTLIGDIPGPQATATIRVRQARAILVPNP